MAFGGSLYIFLFSIRLYGTWGYRGFAPQERVRKTAFVVFGNYDLDQRGSALMTVLILLPLMMMDGTKLDGVRQKRHHLVG
jgi:hypothetical protein